MCNKILMTIFISLLSTITMADSISITVKPAKGLSGTTSLTIHDDGNVTILTYESAIKISENTINIKPNDKNSLRLQTISAIAQYLNQDSYKSLKSYSFTVSLAHTADGVTKNISSKRLNKEAVKVIKQLTTIVPAGDLQYVKDEI
ncbi:MAG: hypothetical protein COB22_05705 [Cycloclasticus sp.]|nr:MAG: hypothetical protein COB22_05705 [Cycloclasticus sp.]